MSDGFETLVDEANAFNEALAADNTKAFYEPRKEHYRDAIKRPAKLLRDLLTEDLSRVCGRPLTGKLFRIHRDVRFSKDKTPYNPWLHLIWQEGRPAAPGPDHLDFAFFLAVDPGREPYLAHGIVAPSGPSLARLRAFFAEWGGLVENALEEVRGEGAEFTDFGPNPLKRVPKPYPPDHPHAQLLRRKSLIVAAPLTGWRETGLVRAATDKAAALAPLTRLFAERL